MRSHNWRHDALAAAFRCEDLPLAEGVKAAGRCYGCGRTVSDKRLRATVGDDAVLLRLINSTLDMMAA